jgi:RNA polymerase sigma-70 factor, ECF subfamily
MKDEPAATTEPGSFDELILPHLDAAYNFARWLVRNRDDAEDVAQEACLRAFRYFGTFRGGNARAWLLRIVRTTSFSWLQKHRGRQLETVFDEELHSSPGEDQLNPETMLLHSANTELIAQAIAEVPDRWREVLVLRELEGLSYKEIADVVSIPVGTVMSTLSRARERFRRRLSELLRRQQQQQGAQAVCDEKLRQAVADTVSGQSNR